MLILVCRDDQKKVHIVIENTTNAISLSEEEIEVLGVETAMLFNDDMKLTEIFYELVEE